MDKRRFKFSHLNNFSHSAIDWIGSIPSLLVHTFFFASSFALIFFGFSADKVLLVVTTLVSLEAIYLAIFIQMSVNLNSQSLAEVEENIDEIQEDVEEIQKDVDEIQKDVDEIQEDVEEIEKDVDEIQEDVEEIQKEDEEEDEIDINNRDVLEKIESQLQILIKEVEKIKASRK